MPLSPGRAGRFLRCAHVGPQVGPLAGAEVQPVSTEHPSIVRFREAHSRLGGTGEIVILPDSVHTAALAAEALGCEVGAIANSLLFDADGPPVLILTSGAHRVDTDAVAERIGVTAPQARRPRTSSASTPAR